MKDTKNIKISWLAVYLVCLAVALAVYCFCVFLPQSQDTARLQLQHGQNEQQILSDNDLINKKSSLLRQLSKLQKDKIDAAKMPGISASSIGDDISAGLKKAGIAAKSVALSDETETPGSKKSSAGLTLTKVTVTLSFECSPDQLNALVAYYEKQSAAIYCIDTISFTGKNTESAVPAKSRAPSAPPAAAPGANYLSALASSQAPTVSKAPAASGMSTSSASGASSKISSDQANQAAAAVLDAFLATIAAAASRAAAAQAASSAPAVFSRPAASNSNPTVSMTMTAYYYSKFVAKKS